MEQQQQAPVTIIVGGGIIGASIAYHLSLLSRPSLILEQHSPACAASGRAGGFLALDWCDSSPLRHLARPSFPMHASLARSLPHDVGYRTLESYSLSLRSPNASATAATTSAKHHNKRPRPNTIHQLAWLDGNAAPVHPARSIGTTRTNAQVHPYKLTHALLAHARASVGTEVVIARVEHVRRDSHGKWLLSTRANDGQTAQRSCDVLILAMGPWTINARDWFPALPPVVAHKAASLVVKAEVPATALFTEYVNARGVLREPEAYPRSDEVYLCQSAVPEDLPDDPGMIGVHENDVEDLKEFGRGLSRQLADAMEDPHNVVAQACNLPASPDGVPVIGPIPGTDDTAFVATGHSCWGILNSPATGKAVAELIVRGESSIDISAFSPERFG